MSHLFCDVVKMFIEKKQNNMSIIYRTSHEGPFKYAFNYKYKTVLYF